MQNYKGLQPSQVTPKAGEKFPNQQTTEIEIAAPSGVRSKKKCPIIIPITLLDWVWFPRSVGRPKSNATEIRWNGRCMFLNEGGFLCRFFATDLVCCGYCGKTKGMGDVCF
ncbi:hypothetical protein QE152_g39268 [Popillia japonica]|uniref:Uncharacterized protein n=1 Tax=Popillia japonica TaxID=7064 RepID=A0AAW1HU28_POPJA